MSRHRSSVGLRWPSKRIAALHRLPIRSVLAARCALRCAPMAARSLRHLTGDATLCRVTDHLSVCAGHRSASRRCIACQYARYGPHAAPCAALRWLRAACDI
ncbi:hypothetical protein [Verminephrobacter eiseniae]|uniref:hypothetical protein n=1 Tax=Verminephrobacter eiseniae TaxID=364317 RepID=UPI0012EDC909|nr:hypothetical protein [Verminephrobacter eiseniae]